MKYELIKNMVTIHYFLLSTTFFIQHDKANGKRMRPGQRSSTYEHHRRRKGEYPASQRFWTCVSRIPKGAPGRFYRGARMHDFEIKNYALHVGIAVQGMPELTTDLRGLGVSKKRLRTTGRVWYSDSRVVKKHTSCFCKSSTKETWTPNLVLDSFRSLNREKTFPNISGEATLGRGVPFLALGTPFSMDSFTPPLPHSMAGSGLRQSPGEIHKGWKYSRAERSLSALVSRPRF